MGELSLRDYFAAKAMAAFIVASAVSKESYCDLVLASDLAYSASDAMLTARSKP